MVFDAIQTKQDRKKNHTVHIDYQTLSNYIYLLHHLIINVLYFSDDIHCHPKVKVQLALLFPSFVHYSSINKLKNMKLSEHICYEMIN